MSQIQQATKPLLVPLIEGFWPANLDIVTQRLLAVWATMFTMLVECADPPTMASAQSDRDQLRLTRDPLANWYIWLGRNMGPPAQYYHYGAGLYTDQTPSGRRPPCNMQITTFTVGKAVFQTLGGPTNVLNQPEIRSYIVGYGAGLGLERIWPHRHDPIIAPSLDIDAGNIRAVATSLLGEIIGLDPDWHGSPILFPEDYII